MKRQQKFPYMFFVVTFVWSWIIWIPLVLAGSNILPIGKDLVSALSLPMSILAAFGPAVGAFYCIRTLHGKDALHKYLRSLMDFHLGWEAWLIPIIILGLSTWLAWMLPELWGEPRLDMLLPSLWVFPPYLLIMIFLGGGQEELGWRGYILDIIEDRLGIFQGNLVLGLIWAVWHLPLFFIPGTSQNYMPFTGFILLTIGYSWIFSWVRQLSGKRTLSGLIVHGWANAFIPLFPTIIMSNGTTQSRFWIWVCLTFTIGLITIIVRSKKTKNKSHNNCL